MTYHRLVCTAEDKVKWGETKPNNEHKILSVKTLFTSISIASELSELNEEPYPKPLGYQTIGEVASDVETDLSGLQKGDRVLTFSGHTQLDYLNPEEVIKVPDHISSETALCAILGEDTYKGIRKVNPDKSSKIIIYGAGLGGLLTLYNLSSRGCENIDVVEPNVNRHKLAYTFGADKVYKKAPDKKHYTHGFECSASPRAFHNLCGQMLPNAKICILSDGNYGDFYLPRSFYVKELHIVGSSDGEDYKEYADWLFDNPDQSLLKQLYEHEIHYEQLPTYFDALKKSKNRPITTLVNWQ